MHERRRKAPPTPPRAVKVAEDMVAAARARGKRRAEAANVSIFKPAEHPPGVIPENAMAMDEAFDGLSSWGGDRLSSAFAEGQAFLGYPYLAELAQRPEYRKAVEIIAWEMTRKWIKFTASGKDDKTDKIAKIDDEFKRLKVKQAFRKAAEKDGFFGRSHIFLDFGHNDADLDKPIGDGSEKASRAKVAVGSLQGLRVIEGMWAYPLDYNSTDPLKANWYQPQVWGVMGKTVHRSRLITFVGREVPDMLKPAYSFGGLSLTQMMKAYVDIWLKTRESIANLVYAFSVMVLATNMGANNGVADPNIFSRVDLFNQMRSNDSTFVIDKETEEFSNVSAPVAGLEGLQAQSQEHICAVTGIPLVKYTGITPSGLNASADGELRVFYDSILAYQVTLFEEPIEQLLRFVQLSIFGEVDPGIGFEFVPLWELSAKERAEVRKIEAETAQIEVDLGALSAQEERQRIASEDDTPYPGLDVEEMPDLLSEEEGGLVVRGGTGESGEDAGLSALFNEAGNGENNSRGHLGDRDVGTSRGTAKAPGRAF
jgi:hypothetical protein